MKIIYEQVWLLFPLKEQFALLIVVLKKSTHQHFLLMILIKEIRYFGPIRMKIIIFKLDNVKYFIKFIL